VEKSILIGFPENCDHKFFGYVEPKSLSEAKTRIKRGVSLVVFFIIDGAEKFAAIVDLHKGCCQSRGVGVPFLSLYNFFKIFGKALPKCWGLRSITFKTEIDGVKYLAKKAGFALNGEGDYERVLV